MASWVIRDTSRISRTQRLTYDGLALYSEHMNAHTDTPIYDQVFEEALAHAVDIDNMEQLTILENMNSDTAIQPSHTNRNIPF